MEIIYLNKSLENVELPPCAATIGFFDGVHRGHQYLLNRVAADAHSHGLASMVITFGEHPRQVLQSDYRPHLLTTPEERLSLLSTTGVDCCVVLPFDLEMASLSARSFMDTVLKQTLHVERLHIGYDHHFGHDRSEGFEQYVGYGRDLGITVVHEEGLRLSAFMNQIPANLSGETAVSSSLVRRLLSEGLVDEAAILLGRFYDITGRVVGGAHEGRQLGYPTANLDLCCSSKLVPSAGVYAVLVQNGQPAMMNIGTRPTYGEGHPQTLEVHILNFSADLYGQQLTVHFVSRLRGERRFDSPSALAEQLCADARETSRRLRVASQLFPRTSIPINND